MFHSACEQIKLMAIKRTVKSSIHKFENEVHAIVNNLRIFIFFIFLKEKNVCVNVWSKQRTQHLCRDTTFLLFVSDILLNAYCAFLVLPMYVLFVKALLISTKNPHILFTKHQLYKDMFKKVHKRYWRYRSRIMQLFEKYICLEKQQSLDNRTRKKLAVWCES